MRATTFKWNLTLWQELKDIFYASVHFIYRMRKVIQCPKKNAGKEGENQKGSELARGTIQKEHRAHAIQARGPTHGL